MKTRISARWDGALIICGKCSRRMDGGFGKAGKASLTKALKQATGGSRKRKAPMGIIESRCLGICPRGAGVVIDAAAPDQWWLIRRGADVDQAVEDILAARRAAASNHDPA